MSNAQKDTDRRVDIITNALLHLPIRGAELQFAARQVELALRAAPTPDVHSEVGVRANPFNAVRFDFVAASGDHEPSYLVAVDASGSGPMIPINGHADYKVDDARAKWMADTLNSALAGVVKDLNEVISSKIREIEPLMPVVTYRSGGVYVAEVERLAAKAKEQQSTVVGGPDGDSILGYTIPTGTWLMLQAKIGSLIEALTAGVVKAEPVAWPVLEALAEGVVQDVCEWDDRTSPEGYEEYMFLTPVEFRNQLMGFARQVEAHAVSKEAVRVPEKWMLEPAAVYLEMVDDDETGSNLVVAKFLRALASKPEGERQMADIAVPDWVAGFLNRRTDVENLLRAPLKAQAKGLPMPDGFPLSAEAMNALADRLSVPDEFMPARQDGAKQ